MLPIKKAAVMLGAFGALALPSAAQADNVNVNALTIHASVNLQGAQRLMHHHGSHSAIWRLLKRSRHELQAAVSGAEQLLGGAGADVPVTVASQIQAQVSTALAQDVVSQAQIATGNVTSFATQAASALLADVQAQQTLISDTLSTTASVDAQGAQQLLNAAMSAEQSLTSETQGAMQIAGNAGLSLPVQASGQLAVGVATAGLGNDVQVAQGLVASVPATAQTTATNLVSTLTGAVAQLTSSINASDLGNAPVKLPVLGQITLGALAQLGVNTPLSHS